MELLVNDRSLHGQFSDNRTFDDALRRMMHLRTIAKRFGRQLSCHRSLGEALVGPNLSMRQALGKHFNKEQTRAMLGWLTKHGPFWDDVREHSGDDFMDLECEEELVTDTAVGEAAYRCLHGAEHRLVSFIPSTWERSPITVRHRRDDRNASTVDVYNHWDGEDLESVLDAAPANIQSWKHLEEMCISRYQRLTFAAHCFSSLRGHPFSRNAANRSLVLFHALNQFRSSFNQQGELTEEGHEIYQKHFTGDSAWFSDSSETEKRTFKKELTFPNPSATGETLFCTWHGKIRTTIPYRIHFSWPVRADTPLYVVYIGPKITKL